MDPNIIYCRDCKYRIKKMDWMWCQSKGKTIWECKIGRGKTFTDDVDLNDFCSSAIKIKEDPDEHNTID